MPAYRKATPKPDRNGLKKEVVLGQVQWHGYRDFLHRDSLTWKYREALTYKYRDSLTWKYREALTYKYRDSLTWKYWEALTYKYRESLTWK